MNAPACTPTQQPAWAGAHRVEPGVVAHVALMLVVGLDVPAVSSVAMVVAGLCALHALCRNPVVGPSFVWRGVLLFAGLSTYYVFAVGHALVQPSRAVALTLVLASGYVAGYAAARTEVGWWGRIAGLVVAVLALTAYAGLSTLGGAGVEADVFARDELRVRSLWSGTLVTSTLVGAQTALGVALLPAALLWPSRRRAEGAVRAVFAGAAALALHANLVLQNRSPFLAGGLALATCALLAGTPGLPARRTLSRLGLAALGVAALLAAGGWERLARMGAMQRFASDALDTARYDAWAAVALHMAEHPTGGRRIALSESAAHNLWLDVAWDAGPLPFFLLLTFHLGVVFALLRALGRVPPASRLILVGVGVAFASTAMAEPAMNLTSWTALSFYFCGLAVGLASLPARWAEAPR